LTELWFAMGMLAGSTVTLIILSILRINKSLPDEEFPIQRRASDEGFLSDEEIADLRGLRDDDDTRS